MARNQLLTGKVFHDEAEFRIPPLASGLKGREYVYDLQRCLASIQCLELEKFRQTGEVAAECLQRGGTVWCDVVGHHLMMQRGMEEDPGLFRLGTPETGEEAGPFSDGDMYLYNGYYVYPEKELARVRAAGIPSAWLLGGREVAPIYPQPGEIHLDAYWRYGDASLTIPGYDLAILPVSGVLMTTTLWMLVAETAGNLAAEG